MSEGGEENKAISRRSVITHFATGVFGWFLGTFLDPLRRVVNRIVFHTPLGRKAKISFGYAEIPKTEEKEYMVQIANAGNETAKDLAAHIGFEEQITAVKAEDWINTPPAPDTSIEITDGGIARITTSFVRRDVGQHLNPIRIHFTVEEGTESDFAWRIDDNETMFTAYRYSWTFLGERYYESTDHHIVSDK